MHWFEHIKQSNTLYDFLYHMPKGGDLHNHLSGSGHPEWWWQAALNLGYMKTTSEKQKQIWILKAHNKSHITPLIKKPEILAEIMYLNMKFFADEGVRYVEFQIPSLKYIPALQHRLAQQDAKDTEVEVNFHGVVRRGHYRRKLNRRASMNIQIERVQSPDIVGINLIDHLCNCPFSFEGVNLPISIHAGETTEKNFHVRDALNMGASRISHAINLIHDPETMDRMRDQSILIETSLLSNKHFDVIDFKNHPFPQYLRHGIPISLCTDDRGLWKSTLTDEFYAAVTTFDLTWEEVKQISRNSLEYSFVDDTTKQRMLKNFDIEIQNYGSDGNALAFR